MRKIIITVLTVLLLIPMSIAQENGESSVTLVETDIVPFGITASIPDGWTAAGPGAYARGAMAGDTVSLVVQAAPLDRERVVASLLPRLAVEALPESVAQIETESYTWDVHIFDISVQNINLTIHAAFAGTDQTTLVIMQTPPDEAEALQASVFYPVIDSIRPTAAEADETPQEELPYSAEDITFPSADINLAGTLTLPEGDAPFVAVVLVSGSGAQDRNENLAGGGINFAPFAQLADTLTRAGYAVLRYDDRGVAQSEGDYAASGYDEFTADAVAAVDYLLTRDEIDSEKIIVLGHSEGGHLAPRIAVESGDVAGFILMAGPVTTLRETIILQNDLTLRAEGVDDERINAQVAAQSAVWDLLEANADDDALREAVIDLVTIQLNGAEPDDVTVAMAMGQFQSPYIQSVVDYDPATYYDQLSLPVLAIFGGLDVQVDAQQNIDVIGDLISDENLTLVTVEQANHLFQEAETGAFSEYATLDPVLMPEFLDTIVAWLDETIR